MNESRARKIILEDGQEFVGTGFGDMSDRVCEIVFNTSMAGYQEILSDPSYTDQAVVFTYPLIGNYGMAEDDYETERPTIGALIVHEYNDEPSGSRCADTLGHVMQTYGIPGIEGLDTRKLNRYIRDHGSCRAALVSADMTDAEALEMICCTPVPKDAVSRVSCRRAWTSGDESLPLHVAAVDCGIKHNIIRSLNARGCRVTVVPYDTTAEEIISLDPDGVFISNGPGDPADVPQTAETVRRLLGRYPVFGICLGHQILSLAYGAKTYKLKFGHRGGNHPVKDLKTGRLEITSQNHSYAVDTKSLAGTPLELTHINLLDGTAEGVECLRDRAFGVQYHPESAPGPQDSGHLFDRFVRLMEEVKADA